jgi:hypothetical protein
VTANNDSKTYDGVAYSGGNGVNYTGLVNGQDSGVLGGTLSFNGDSQGATDAGSYTITPGGLTSGNYSLSYVDGALTINRATPTLTWSNPADIVYGTALDDAQLNATADVAGALTYDPASGTVLNAGNSQTLSVTFTPTDTVNYNPANAAVQINVAKATPVITWSNPADIVYGTALGDAQLNATADLAGALTYDPASGTVLNAGNSQTLSVTYTPTDTVNYNLANAAVQINVNPAPLTITADTLSRGYGATNPVFTAGYNGFVNGDGSGVLTGTLSFSCLDTNSVVVDTNTPVGAYPIVVSGQSAANYNLTHVNGTLTVTQAVLTVTADNQSRAYGATNPELTVSYSGFVNGEDTNVLNGRPDLNTGADTNSAVGTYPIEISLGTLSTNGNYSFNFTNGTLTVTAYALTVSVDSQTRAYGQTNAPLSGTVSGLQNGDTITAGYTTSADTNSDVSVYPITVSLTDLDNKLSNYTVTTNGGTLTVTQAVLTVTANNDSKTYDGVAYSGGNGVNYTGLVNGQDSGVLGGTLTFNGNSQGATDAGSYTITPAGLTNDNYTITFADGTLTVTQAVLTVTANNDRKTYDGVAYSGGNGVNYTGFVNGEDSSVLGGTLSYTGASQGAINADTYTITPEGLTSDNYSLSYVEGTLTITPANSANVLISSENPSSQGSNVTFTATLTPVSPATTTPTGDVQFFTNGVTLGGPVALDGGVASISTAQLPPGSNTVTAVYAGSTDFQGSTNSLVQVVTLYLQTPSTLGIKNNLDGTVTITFAGTPEGRYVVQATANLAPVEWTNVSTNTAATDGQWTFTDSMTTYSQRFYRSAKP